MNNLISVIIPARDAGQTIEATLRSALLQTYADIEIIVIDDGSSDNTKHIVQKYIDCHSRITLQPIQHSGVAAARNRGIEVANGDLIAFLDADDIWHPEKLEIQRRYLLDAENTAFVYSPIRLIDEDSRVVSTPPFLHFEGNVLKHMLLIHFINTSSSLLCRREAVQAIGGFDTIPYKEGHQGCEDYLFSIRMASKYNLAVAPFYLTGYRCHSSNMSNNHAQMRKSEETILKILIVEFPNIPKSIFKFGASNEFAYMFYKALKSGQLIESARIASAGFTNNKLVFLKVLKNIALRHILTSRKNDCRGKDFTSCEVAIRRSFNLEMFYLDAIENNQFEILNQSTSTERE